MSEGWTGHRLDSREGSAAGKIVRVVGADGARWLVVRTGRLGRFTAVPAGDAVEGVGCVWVPYERELIRSAPKLESSDELGADAERRLREHYAISES